MRKAIVIRKLANTTHDIVALEDNHKQIAHADIVNSERGGDSLDWRVYENVCGLP